MPIKEAGSYKVRIVGATLTENTKGRPGLQLRFSGEEGQISETFWITENTLQRIRQNIITCGVPEESLQTTQQWEDFWAEPAAYFPPNHEVMIVAEMEEYNGESKIRVKWINYCARPAKEGTSKTLASMFANADAPRPKASVSFINDQDLPF